MPDNALVKVAPEVITLARPEPKLLLGARLLVQQTAEINEVFRRSKEERWSAEQLAREIEEPLQGRLDTNDPQEVVQVARYLADEYQQIGDTMLLISRETGKAIGRITDEDVWHPSPVPREGGTMAQPLPRLRPELEAFLIHWHFERGREEKITAELVPGLHQTDLLKADGDPRLLPVTRTGRNQLVGRLRDLLPKLLLMTSGSVGQFLTHFEVRGTEPEKGHSFEPILRCTAIARSVTGIQDPKAMNLHFPRLGALCGSIGNSWGREVARTLAVAAKEHYAPTPKTYTDLDEAEVKEVSLWVGSPDIMDALARQVFRSRQTTLPVEHAPTIGIRGKVGAIVVDPNSYECHGRELFDRWEVAAKFEYTLWVDWAEVRAFDLQGVEVSAQAIVVR